MRRLLPALAAAAAASALLWTLPAGTLTSTATGATRPVAAAGASGVAVTAVRHLLDRADPTVLAAVEVEIAAARGARPATAVQVRLRPDGPWHRCSTLPGPLVCPTPGEPVAGVAAVEIVSAR